MIILTLFTELSTVDMLATITNMTTHFLLTIISSICQIYKRFRVTFVPVLATVTTQNSLSCFALLTFIMFLSILIVTSCFFFLSPDPQLPHKIHGIVSLCSLLLCFFLFVSLNLAFSSSLLIYPLLSLYFNPSLLTASLVHDFQSSVAYIFLTCIGEETR